MEEANGTMLSFQESRCSQLPVHVRPGLSIYMLANVYIYIYGGRPKRAKANGGIGLAKRPCTRKFPELWPRIRARARERKGETKLRGRTRIVGGGKKNCKRPLCTGEGALYSARKSSSASERSKERVPFL